MIDMLAEMSKCYSFVYQQHQLSSTKKKSENFPLLSKQERSWMLCFGVLLCVWTNVIWRLMEQTTTQSFLKRIHFFSTDTTHFSYCKMIHFFFLFIFLQLAFFAVSAKMIDPVSRKPAIICYTQNTVVSFCLSFWQATYFHASIHASLFFLFFSWTSNFAGTTIFANMLQTNIQASSEIFLMKL